MTEYRPVAGHPGYRVGADGSIWTAWEQGGRIKGWFIGDRWKKMSPAVRRLSRHQCVLLRGDPKRECLYLHRLVIEAFFGPPADPSMEVLHIDGNPSNNAIDNLAWATHSEIMQGRFSARRRARSCETSG